MRSALLLFLLGVLLSPSAQAQEDLPIDPDSIYSIIAETSERMTEGHELPSRLSVQEWREDLDTLAARIHRRVPYAESATGGAKFHRRLDSLKRTIPQQTRDQRILSVMRLTDLLAPGTQHTGIDSWQRALGWRMFPVWPYRFTDGVYIMSAADTSLIGNELLSIGGTPIDSVYAALAPYSNGDGSARPHDVERWLLRFADPLRAVGVVDQIDKIPVRVRSRDGTISREVIESMSFDSAEFVRFLTSGATRPRVPKGRQWAPPSKYQRSRQPNAWYSYRDSTDLLYLQYNVVAPPSEEMTAEDLANSLRTIVDDRPIKKFVLDLRTNTGGSQRFAEPIVELLSSHPKINQRGTLYTLVSWATFSAAGLMTMELERRTKTIFAGDPSRFAPNIWGETAPILLPNSKITVDLSFAYYQASMPDDPRSHLGMDMQVPLTSDQYFQNVDSVLIAVKQHEPAPRKTGSLSLVERDQFTGTYRMSPVHRAEITAEKNGLRLRVDRGEPFPFIDSELYPLSERRLATDIADVYVERRLGEAGLTLAWKDTTYTLAPVEGRFSLPLERIRAGRLDEGGGGLRSTLASGMKLGNNFTEYPLTDLVEENPIPAWPDTLSREEKARRALPYTKLATELSPISWRSWADLAWLYKILGQRDEGRRSAQRAVTLHPTDGADFIREYLDLTVAQDGTVQ